MQSILEKDAAKEAESICFLDLEKNVAMVESKKGLLSKLDAEILAAAKWKVAKGTRAEESFNEIFSQLYLGFVLRVLKAVVRFSCNEVFKQFQYTSEIPKICRARGGARKELRVPRENRNIFAP